MKKIDTSQIKNWPEGVLLAVTKLELKASPEILSQTEKQEFNSFSSPQRKSEYLLGRHLFRLLLRELNIQSEEVEIRREEKGKPYAMYGDEIINVSFTHSPELVMCAVSRKRKIGIDIESTTRSINERVIKRILSEKEQQTVGKENPVKLWTIKEAAAKCAGTGLSNLGNIFIQKNHHRYHVRINNDIIYEICSFKQSGHQVTLAYQSKNF